MKSYKRQIALVVLAIISIVPFFIFTGKAKNISFSGVTSTQGSYTVISGAKGYVTKTDPTNTPPDYLVAGSQNVIINDQEKVESRAGYELAGVASSTSLAIDSEFSWKTSSGVEYLLRKASSTLYARTATSSDFSFESVYEALSATTTVRFATAWNSAENLDALLFVDGDTLIYEWSGGRGTYTSSTLNTITLNENVGRSRFWNAGTRQVRVLTSDGWITFAYTGISNNQFTGVTPDPTTYTITNNTPVLQAVRSIALTLQSGNAPFNYHFISVLQNQVYLGGSLSRQVYVSKDTSYSDFSYSSPRVVGQGADLILDDVTVGFAPADEKTMLVFSGDNRLTRVSYTLSAGDTSDREVPEVEPVLIAEGQGAKSQELIAKIKKAVVWVSNNNELVELGQVENLPSPQAVSISDPIKPDLIDADFSNGEIEFWKNSIFISASDRVFIYDLSKRFWQPPQIMDVRRFSVYEDDLYGHSYSTPQSYKLFTGLNDNGSTVEYKAHFAYQNGGRRDALKNFDRYLTEMFLASNTKVTVSILYEWMGSKNIVSYELDGADQTFLFTPSINASLGVNSLGTTPLGGVLAQGENTAKYRRFKPLVPVDNFEFQPRFESDSDDGAFQIISHGASLKMSGNIPSAINR